MAPIITGNTTAGRRAQEQQEEELRLRELAHWYRLFADRAGNPAIWEARLRTAKELEQEADRLEEEAAQGTKVPTTSPNQA
jgi:aminoglycoside phosphotransferase